MPTPTAGPPERTRGALSSAGLVVASMVGTGVYTTSGILLEHLSAATVVVVWLVGGVCALAGALSYAELGVRFPHQGGEYALLGRGLHPAAGFMAGAISVVVGFAAPIAACALAFSHYLGAVAGAASSPLVALAVVWVTTLLQLGGRGIGERAQDAMAVVALTLAVGLVVVGLPRIEPAHLALEPQMASEIFSPAAGLGVVLVSFSYSGWNAATYVAGEVRDPRRTLPLALVLGTLTVTLLYVALNVVFVASAPRDALSGHVEVAFAAARSLFGEVAASVLAVVVALGLLSTTGALVTTGSRVAWAMGVDHRPLRVLGKTSARGAPVAALVLQAALASALCLFADVEGILTLVGMTLSLVTAATVVASLRARFRQPAGALRGSLLASLLYLVVVGATVILGSIERPDSALASLAVVAASGVGYFVVTRRGG